MRYKIYLIGLIFLLLNLNCKILQSSQVEQNLNFEYFIDGRLITVPLLSDLLQGKGKFLNLSVKTVENLDKGYLIKKEEVYVVYIRNNKTPSWSVTAKLENDSSKIGFAYPNEVNKNHKMLFRLKYSIFKDGKFVKTIYDETVFKIKQ